MNKNFTLSFLILLSCFFSNAVFAQCPTGDITLSTQTEVNEFATNYPGCTAIPAGVEITISGNNIFHLDGLLVLTEINGNLEIEDCDDLTSLAGLQNITTVNPDGEIEIENCDALTSLNGLQNLTSCHNLEIKHNASLSDISALQNLANVSGEFVVKNNPSLSNCDALCGAINNGIDPNSVNVEVFGNGGFPCDDFNDWETNCALIALPVDLADFTGYAIDRSNMLKWQTESEENTMVFIVERSLDGRRDFIEIGRVNAFGNSTTMRSYELEDGNPVSFAYYRLRIVDFDGTFEFSDVITVERAKTEIDVVEIFPVPAEDEVTVLVHAKTSGKAIMTLSDFMGRRISEERVNLKAGINRYEFNFGDHETNLYYLTIYNGNERIAKKILRATED